MDIHEGNEVTWTEWGRTWTGVVKRVSLVHVLVQPTLPKGTAGWIKTELVTKVEEREALRG